VTSLQFSKRYDLVISGQITELQSSARGLTLEPFVNTDPDSVVGSEIKIVSVVEPRTVSSFESPFSPEDDPSTISIGFSDTMSGIRGVSV